MRASGFGVHKSSNENGQRVTDRRASNTGASLTALLIPPSPPRASRTARVFITWTLLRAELFVIDQ